MVTVPHGFVGPLRPGTTREPKPTPVIVKDPKTGKTWKSVKEYVKDPKKYGGGTRTFRQEFEKRQAEEKARKAAEEKARKAAEEKARKAAEEKARKLAEEKAKIEAMRKAGIERQKEQEKRLEQERLAKIERTRLYRERARIIAEGGRVKTIDSTDAKTGDKLKITTWTKGSERIMEIENIDKGITTYTSYGVPRGGGAVRQTGGLIITEKRNTLSDIKRLQDQLLTGEKLIYNTKTMKILGIESSRLRQSIPYTEKGIEFYNKQMSKITPKFDIKKFLEESAYMASLGKQSIIEDEKGKFIKGFQKVAVSPRFWSKELKEEQKRKEKPWKDLLDKMSRGEKFNQADIETYKKVAKISPEDIVDKDVAQFAKITGGVIGTVVPGAQVPGAIFWAMGDAQEKVRISVGDGGKITKEEFQKIVIDSATKGVIMGFTMKVLSVVAPIASKRIITGAALRNVQNKATIAALNHGGQIIRIVGKLGKNFISTYFYKDTLGNIFDVTVDVKDGKLNNALRKAIETGGAVGGYIGGSALGKRITGGVLFAVGKLKGVSPEFAQKKIPADVMAKQLLSKGKIILTRRGVYETGKGLSPRHDAWLDQRIKNPTKSIFWRFDKTLSPKDQVISPLPTFTKGKSAYWKMFKANWNKNKQLGIMKRYIKTTAETPMADDVVIRQIVHLKDIKDVALKKQIIKEYATTGKLSQKTQNIVLKKNFPISDKNREFGFHDENEYVTRTAFKLEGRKDISWAYDPTIKEYVPVVQNLKDTSKIKNWLSILNKKGIITRTDAQFIKDNYAIKIKFGAKSILPKEHSWKHMKNVQDNIIKIIDKYPEFNNYWIKRYGSVANAKKAMKQAMWHDIGKGEAASKAFGTPHGEKVWRVWKKGLLPKELKMTKEVALAIKKHETLDPRRLWYKVQNRVKLISPEEKIVATADRLDLNRVGIKIDLDRLPLRDAIKRLGIKVKWVEYPSKFNAIINKIKLDKGVTISDIKKLLSFMKTRMVKDIKIISKKVVIPSNIKTEFKKLLNLKIKKKGFTDTLRKRYNSLLKKYPGLRTDKLEIKDISTPKIKKLSKTELNIIQKEVNNINKDIIRKKKIIKSDNELIKTLRNSIIRDKQILKLNIKKLSRVEIKKLKNNIFSRERSLLKLKNIFRRRTGELKEFYIKKNKLTEKIKFGKISPSKRRSGESIEDFILRENEAKYKKLSPAQKKKLKIQEKEYKDYKEAKAEYKRIRKGKKITPIPYKTTTYKTYKTPKQRIAYKLGYTAGHNAKKSAPINYKTNKGRYQSIYATGYKDSYKGNYKIDYKTGKYTYKGKAYRPYTPYKPKQEKKAILPMFIPKGFKKKKLKAKQDVYFVVAKRKGKLVKLLAKPLVLSDAKNYLAYSLDHSLARSAWLEPIGKTREVLRLPPKMSGYFSKNVKKLRPFKIKRGKKKLIRNGWIEKSKYVGDQPREIKQLHAAKRKAIKRKVVPTKKSKKTTSPKIKRVVKRRATTKPKIKKITTKKLKKNRAVKKVSKKVNTKRKSQKKKVQTKKKLPTKKKVRKIQKKRTVKRSQKKKVQTKKKKK